MNSTRKLHYLKAWGKNLFGLQALSAILSSFGALWLLVEMSAFFFQNTQLPDVLRSFWFVFAAAGSMLAAVICRPKLSVSCRLTGRDTFIEIAVGDLFDFSGALIIGSNTTFDTHVSRQLISEKSVQGSFTRKYYGDEAQLEAEIAKGLGDLRHQVLQGNRVGKSNRYPMGTVVRLSPKERTAYFVAIAHLNEHGAASSSFDNLKESLAKLWVFIGQCGPKETLVMPVLGTGFCRLPQPREEVVREIIQSFVAACAEVTFCDKLTIVLSPDDVEKHAIEFHELGLYLQHVTKYTCFNARNGSKAVGTPVLPRAIPDEGLDRIPAG